MRARRRSTTAALTLTAIACGGGSPAPSSPSLLAPKPLQPGRYFLTVGTRVGEVSRCQGLSSSFTLPDLPPAFYVRSFVTVSQLSDQWVATPDGGDTLTLTFRISGAAQPLDVSGIAGGAIGDTLSAATAVVGEEGASTPIDGVAIAPLQQTNITLRIDGQVVFALPSGERATCPTGSLSLFGPV